MRTAGFYKVNEEGTALIYAPNAVYGPGFSLFREFHDTETYPQGGWTWYDSDSAAYAAEGLSFTPVETEPTISRHQAKIVLMQYSLLDTVNALMASADPALQIAWAEAPYFRRNSPAILAMGAALGLDEATVDGMFEAARQVDI